MTDDSLPTPKDAPTPGATPQVPEPIQSTVDLPQEDVESGKLLAVLSYVISPLWRCHYRAVQYAPVM